MEYRVLAIPGETTIHEDNPDVAIVNHELSRPDLVVRYAAAPIEHVSRRATISYGVLTFHQLKEYRWVDSELSYAHFDDDLEDADSVVFGLIEVIDSRWVEKMRSESRYLKAIEANPGRTNDLTIVHYRLTFEEYGAFDILARSVTTDTIVSQI